MRTSLRRTSILALSVFLALSLAAGGTVAHLGDSDHIHKPATHSTAASAVWCVRFTDDPAVWRPEGETSVDAALIEGRIIFVDCTEVLEGPYSIDAFTGGEFTRFEMTGEPVVPAEADVTPPEDGDAAIEPADDVEYVAVKAWTQHQRKWLHKGDKLGARLTRARTITQARQGLEAIQRHLKAETAWLRKNADRFEPDSCLERDMATWQTRIKQAQRSLNKAMAAVERGDVVTASSQIRQFGRAWTKVEQIYNVGMCDY